jgi:prolyl-tRNA synthetase
MFTDENGERKPVLMGCYGIGTTRLVGAIVEASHDDKGIIWPKTVAPFQVQLVSLNAKDPAQQVTIDQVAEKLCVDLQAAGVEVLWDDRAGLSAGEKFANADLLGLPVRIVISEKSLAAQGVEVKLRAVDKAEIVPTAEAAQKIVSLAK